MKRTVATAMNIWKRRGIFWPLGLMKNVVENCFSLFPRGLIVEPSQKCTGHCRNCKPTANPAELTPKLLLEWLQSRPVKPVTIHFSGKHSDPLAADNLPALVSEAGKHSSMVSISTIGLGTEIEKLQVDRWIFSMPAASRQSWELLRGNNRLKEFQNNLKDVVQRDNAMVELVLTVWKASIGDRAAFHRFATESGVHSYKQVFGRFDPEGHHLGSVENLALEPKNSPYRLNGKGEVELKSIVKGCPLSGTLFLDAAGTLRPCPFTGKGNPSYTKPSAQSWNQAKQWKKMKTGRLFTSCRYCP